MLAGRESYRLMEMSEKTIFISSVVEYHLKMSLETAEIQNRNLKCFKKFKL